MCKKCTKHHHTLLHRDADYSSLKKPEKEEGKEDTHVVAPSASKLVLMTCMVKVTAADGSSSIAKALIIPESSASLVQE